MALGNAWTYRMAEGALGVQPEEIIILMTLGLDDRYNSLMLSGEGERLVAEAIFAAVDTIGQLTCVEARCRSKRSDNGACVEEHAGTDGKLNVACNRMQDHSKGKRFPHFVSPGEYQPAGKSHRRNDPVPVEQMRQ